MHPDKEHWHEAGHAVIARLLGGRVVMVTLETDDEFAGQAGIEWPRRSRAEHARASACVALAGPIAERSFTGAEEPGLEELRAWSHDWAEVERCLTDTPDRETTLREWIAATTALVEDPEIEERIARVADALHAHGTLDEALFLDALD